MIGPEGARTPVIARLAQQLPAKTAQLRTRLAVGPDELPDVVTIHAGPAPEQTGIEGWPFIEVVNRSDRTWVPRPADGESGRAWTIPYGVRIITWALGNDYDHTDRLQKRLHLAVMEIVAAKLALAPGVRIAEESLSSSYSDVGRDDKKRTIAGSYLDLTVFVDETLAGSGVPIVGGITLDTRTLPGAGS